MRKLTYLALGFGAATALCTYGLVSGGFVLAAMLCAAIPGVLFLVFARGKRVPVRIALILLGCAAAFLWYFQFDRRVLSTAAELDGRIETVTIRADDYSYETEYGQAVDGSIQLGKRTYRVRAYLDGKDPVVPGDCLEGSFRFRLTARGGMETATYHGGRGILLLLYQRDAVTVVHGETGLRDLPATLRHRLKAILADAFPEDAQPFAKALLLGDTSDFDYDADTSFKVSGIRHVVAVSGLHVSILFGLLSMVTFRKRGLTALVGFPILFLFAALAGFTPSITRSCLMFGLVLLALLLERDYDGPTALAFSVVVMLLVNPLTVTDVGFQLSVASVAGIYLFSAPIQKWISGHFPVRKDQKLRKALIRWFSLSVSVTLSATVMTIPLCAVYFGTVSLVGVVTNLLALWVISFIFYGILAVCLLGFFWSAGAGAVAWVIAWPIRYVLFVAKVMASIPFAAVYTRSPYITAWLVFLYVLLAVFYFYSRRPGTLACCACLGLCMALLASWMEPQLDQTRLTVLNVGQGQCILLQSGGRTYMVDCGGDSDNITADIAAETLLSQGITRLDGLIVTHLDRDHAGSVENLLSRVDTDLLILPPRPSGLGEYTSGTVAYAAEDLELTFGGVKISIFPAVYAGNSNENSLCILFDSPSCDILITGDRTAFGEKSLLRHTALPKVDVLIAGHHGSKNSTSRELLSAVRPETVCISVSENNSYGHPAPETLERLHEFGCTVYRTDQCGDIIIRR